LIEYGGEQVFELFKPISSPTVDHQSVLSKEQFNKGNIHHPLQLIQSKVPGLLMSMGGGNNPFGRFSARIRGLSSLNGEQPFSDIIYNTVDPLIVVDGIPNVDISMLDPLTIQSMKVIRDGTAAEYGIRGASGVLEISTKNTSSSGLQYHTFLGMDYLDQTMQFLDADVYKGDNFGHKTNWFKEVSQKAYTHTHHLSFSKKQNSTAYHLGVLYKNAEGILKKQGYERLQVNGHFQQTAFEEKLKLNAVIRGAAQDNNYSQPLAFRYAQSYNPTAPVFDERSPYGDYFEQEIIDYYNPVALLDLNPSQGDRRQLVTKVSLQYQLPYDLSIKGDYSKEYYEANEKEYAGENSFWRGNDQNGFAQLNTVDRNNQFFNAYLELTPQLGTLKSLKIGHQYQIQQQQTLRASARDFSSDTFSFNNLSVGDFGNETSTIYTDTSKQSLAAFYGLAQFNWKNTLLINAGMRIEGSSRLGKRSPWGRFPFMTITANLGKNADSFFKKINAQIKAGYGITGNLPYADNLSLKKYENTNTPIHFGGDFIPSYDISNISNPNLTWEQKKEWTFGLSLNPTLFGSSISLEVEVYRNKISGLIQEVQNRLGYTFFANAGRIKNQGIEATLAMEVLRKRNLSWQTSFVMSSTTSILENYARTNDSFSTNSQRAPHSPIGGGCCNENSVLVENGSTIGDLFFLEFQSISADGQWVFEDINKNGVQDTRDKIIAGNGLPNWIVGWNNALRLGNFKLNLFFRGVFGHEVFNVTRALTENPTVISTSNNVLASTFEGESARLTEFPRESSYYVEDASFIRLDNAQLSYTLNRLNNLPFSTMQFYVAANNLFTITKYKGWDPDVRLQSGNDVLAIGYEFRNLYLPTKSWVIGLQLGLK